jgi:hypothetical protein
MAGGELDYLTSRRTRRFSREVTSRSQTAIPLTNYCLALHTRSNTMIMQYTENACSRIRCVHIRNTDLKFWTVSSCLSDSHALCCYFVFSTQNALKRGTGKVVLVIPLASTPKVPNALWCNVTRVHIVGRSTQTHLSGLLLILLSMQLSIT